MNKTKKNILLFLLLPIFVFAQQKDTAFPKTFLWEINGNGLKTPSYLYGTIHVICESDIELPQVLINRINKSKEVYFETSLSLRIDSASIYCFLPKDTTLIDLLGDIPYKKLTQIIVDSTQIDLLLLPKIKPFVASRLLEMTNLNCKTTSYEKEILKIAKQHNIKTNALATKQEHSDIINQIPLSTQTLQLMVQLMSLEMKKRVLESMLLLYKQKDLWQLYYKTAFSEFTNKPSPIKLNFLDKRNIDWIPKMANAMQTKSVFFAVGCAHLPGENGVINLLREEGYNVSPIFYNTDK